MFDSLKLISSARFKKVSLNLVRSIGSTLVLVFYAVMLGMIDTCHTEVRTSIRDLTWFYLTVSAI